MSEECLTKEDLERLAYTLKAVAHPNRLRIICLLSHNGEMNVSDICERMECSQALISHHLNDMLAKGILVLRREGRNAFYALADDRVTGAMRCMMKCTR
ncbi:MAG: metalloregulator ArsR/SmtB family transcription factor [Marinifilaceae bacterium]|nr:metalloregulator ArsR/SmtB family transcription factor [Marinifilaceae bacterium]